MPKNIWLMLMDIIENKRNNPIKTGIIKEEINRSV
jgi:hypothetical protein